MYTMRYITVWDPIIRISHWSLAAAFFTAFLIEDHFLRIHAIAGYIALALVVIRMLWGVIGSTHARFKDFVRPPLEVFNYLKDIATGRARRYLGHNPAGGAMVVALLICLFFTTLSGVALYGARELSGPLAPWLTVLTPEQTELLEESHEWLANFSLVLVCLHLIGVAAASFQHRENLVWAMITGVKAEKSSFHHTSEGE